MRAKGMKTLSRELPGIRARLTAFSRPGHGAVPAYEYTADVSTLFSIIEAQRKSLDEWIRLACKR